MGNRIAGIAIAIAIIFSLEYWLRIEWYIAVPLGILGYLIARYAGYFAGERRYIKTAKDPAKRDQIAN
jgi:hypothetical protein